jgi:hydroxyacylglutathione hydrolase
MTEVTGKAQGPRKEMRIIPALSDNYIYLFPYGSEAFVIDPGDAPPVLEVLDKLGIKLAAILNTHHHMDHVGGNQELKRKTGCDVLGPNDYRIPCMDRFVKEGETLEFGPVRIQVMATPGHTKSHVSYYMSAWDDKNQGMVWTGDTLFLGGCGRLFEGRPEIMWNSLCRLAALPEEVLVYCGHEYAVINYSFASMIEPGNRVVKEKLAGYTEMRKAGKETVPSTIAQEKMTNPFLRSGTPEMKQALNMPNASSAEVFAELRMRKDTY